MSQIIITTYLLVSSLRLDTSQMPGRKLPHGSCIGGLYLRISILAASVMKSSAMNSWVSLSMLLSLGHDNVDMKLT